MGQRTEITKTMRIDWDVPILMRDGTVLRAGESSTSYPARSRR